MTEPVRVDERWRGDLFRTQGRYRRAQYNAEAWHHSHRPTDIARRRHLRRVSSAVSRRYNLLYHPIYVPTFLRSHRYRKTDSSWLDDLKFVIF